MLKILIIAIILLSLVVPEERKMSKEVPVGPTHITRSTLHENSPNLQKYPEEDRIPEVPGRAGIGH